MTKKLLIFIFFQLICFKFSFCQFGVTSIDTIQFQCVTYYTNWSSIGGPGQGPLRRNSLTNYLVSGDTTFNGITGQKIYSHSYSSYPQLYDYSKLTYFGLTYLDSNKIWVKGKNVAPVVLMDYNLKVGDSLLFRGYYKLYSKVTLIDSVLISSQYLKRFKFKNGVTWIEKIGDVNYGAHFEGYSFIYKPCYCQGDTYIEFGAYSNCFFEHDKLVYSYGNSTCYMQHATICNISKPVITSNDSTIFCSGDSVILTSSSANSYFWSNSKTAKSITVKSSGNYSVTIKDINQCSATSAITVVKVNPSPNAPIITNNDNLLTSSETNGNQWYLNGAIINGATSANYTSTQNGNYTVIVTDNNGCAAISSQLAISTGVTELGSYEDFIHISPNPASDFFSIESTIHDKQILRLIDIIGKEVLIRIISFGKTQIDISNLTAGFYSLSLTSNSGLITKQLIIK